MCLLSFSGTEFFQLLRHLLQAAYFASVHFPIEPRSMTNPDFQGDFGTKVAGGIVMNCLIKRDDVVIRIPRLFRDDPPRDGLQSATHIAAMGATGLRVFDTSFMGSDEDKKKANPSLFALDVVVVRQHFPKDLKPLDRFGESRRKMLNSAKSSSSWMGRVSENSITVTRSQFLSGPAITACVSIIHGIGRPLSWTLQPEST